MKYRTISNVGATPIQAPPSLPVLSAGFGIILGVARTAGGA